MVVVRSAPEAIADRWPDEVAHRDHPDRLAAFVKDGDMADPEVEHVNGGVVDGVPGAEGDEVSHRSGGGGPVRVCALGQGDDDIPLGDDAEGALGAPDEESADGTPG
jgi:hypothetical protein